MGEGEHTAVVVIPFALYSLLLCNDITDEYVRAAQYQSEFAPKITRSMILCPLDGE